MPGNEVKEINVEIANSITQAYYSSGAFREMSFFEFTLQYLECLKKGLDEVDKFLASPRQHNSDVRIR